VTTVTSCIMTRDTTIDSIYHRHGIANIEIACDAHPRFARECIGMAVTTANHHFSCDKHWMATCSTKTWNNFGINPSMQVLPAS